MLSAVHMQRAAIEVLEDDGVVVETRELAAGRWTLGRTQRVSLTVGAGGCWVEGPPAILRVNGRAAGLAEVQAGDVLSFDELVLRVHPGRSVEPGPLAISRRRQPLRGVCARLFWDDRLVEQGQTFANRLTPLEGFAVDAVRHGNSYRVRVPEGCEASEPMLAGRFATVPSRGALELRRGHLRLVFELTARPRPSRVGQLAALLGLAALVLAAPALLAKSTFAPTPHPHVELRRHPPAHVKFVTGATTPAPAFKCSGYECDGPLPAPGSFSFDR